MAPTGFHGLLGLILASLVDKKHQYVRIGLVMGSVVPDLDVLGSVLIFLFTANTELTIAFHRSVTHSLVLISLILVVAYFASLWFVSAKTIYFPLTIGLVIGMVLHVFLDLFYFDGVTLFWPFQHLDERIIVLPFTYEDLSPDFNFLTSKIIGTLDGHFELIFYLMFVRLANKYQTNQELELVGGKIKVHNWPNKLKWFSYFLIVEMIFFLLFAFLSISWPSIDRNTFFIILYIPLTPIYLFSGLLPFLMRETIIQIEKRQFI
ncbi:MAG: metal-dependent hydrolase [Candidatus Heimdallarchaeota archaeon]|nr:MAG: metal-dependent hydrolase [Candidatus Heimdallarchaeota archaeon]